MPPNPTTRSSSGPSRPNVEDFRENNRCIACHTEDDSPHFDFEKYWPTIIHNGLDKYDDPKVHQGIEPTRVARQDEGEGER